MEKAKIRFSEDELLLIRNSAWILTKNAVIEKVSIGFGELSVEMQKEVAEMAGELPEPVAASTPKISRGEKYQGLPYVILDYPRVFGREDILAIRTMFWWGNFYSVTLHAKGRFLPSVWKKITSREFSNSHPDLYISFSGNEWNHDVNSEDYQLLRVLQSKGLENRPVYQDFVKLTVKIDVGQWEDIRNMMAGSFSRLLKLV
jgi:hypothetical protein